MNNFLDTIIRVVETLVDVLTKGITIIFRILGFLGEVLLELATEFVDSHRDRMPYYIFCVVFVFICIGLFQWAMWYIKNLLQGLFL